MTFTLYDLEYFLAILMRISGFIFVAPIFSLRNIPQRLKILISIAVTIVVYSTTTDRTLVYTGVIGYAVLMIKETLVGLILGLFATLAYYIIGLAGQMIDMEVGLSNTQEIDPTSRINVTITTSFLNYAITLIMIVTDMHLFILKACIDSIQLIPVGGALFNSSMYESFLAYIANYMILGFRIALPIFASMLVVNTVLAVLAKAAPQVNMFVIGYQLKIFIGLTVLAIMMLMLPSISDIIFNNMIENMRNAVQYMVPQ